MREEISQAVQKALQGSRKVKITFSKKNTDLLHYLVLGMRSGGIVLLPEHDYMVLKRVFLSGKWPFFHNRTTTVTFTDKFDESWLVGFSSYMNHAIEKIEVVN